MVISKVPPSDPGLGTLGTVTPGPLVDPPGGFGIKPRKSETGVDIVLDRCDTDSEYDRLETGLEGGFHD